MPKSESVNSQELIINCGILAKFKSVLKTDHKAFETLNPLSLKHLVPLWNTPGSYFNECHQSPGICKGDHS